MIFLVLLITIVAVNSVSAHDLDENSTFNLNSVDSIGISESTDVDISQEENALDLEIDNSSNIKIENDKTVMKSSDNKPILGTGQYDEFNGKEYYYDDDLTSEILNPKDSYYVGDVLQIKLNDEKNAYNFGSSTKVYVRIDGDTNNMKDMGTYSDLLNNTLFYEINETGSHYFQVVLKSYMNTWFAKGFGITNIKEKPVSNTTLKIYFNSTADDFVYLKAGTLVTIGDILSDSTFGDEIQNYITFENGKIAEKITLYAGGQKLGEMSVGLEPTNSLYVTYKAYTNTSFTNAGVWLINAIYKGNGVLSNATSNNLTIIYYSPSTTALSLDSNSVKKGKSIKITPKVLINSNNYETNDGTIDIYVDDVLVAGNININENYTLDTSSLDLGNHKVHAVYHDFKEEYKGVMYTTINGSSSEKYTFEVIEDTSISTLKIYEEDDPNNTTLLVYPDFASGVTLFLYNSLSNSNFTDDELYDLLKYTGIKCDVYVDGVKVDSTYTGYKNGSTLSSYTKYKLQLNSGKHTVQYYHPGYANKNIPESWSNILTVYVGSVPDYATNISVSLSKNEIKRGESIVITPTVLDKENNNVINEGKVFIYLDNAIVANITAGESYSLVDTNSLTFGEHEVYAIYEGFNKSNLHYLNSTSDKVKFNVTKFTKTTTTTVEIEDNSVNVDVPVVITPIVKDDNGTIIMGLVEIYVNGVKVNTTEVGDNFIYRDTSKAGIYNVSAKYLGDETADTVYAPSSSQNYTFTVKLYSIDIEITDMEAKVGENVTYDFDLGKNVTGNVTVKVGDKSFIGVLDGGKVSINVTGMSAGDYTVVALYSGDDKYEAASSEEASLNITKNDCEITLDAPSVNVGEEQVITVNLPDDATGTVNITVGDKVFNNVEVKNATAIIKVDLPAGNYTVTAVYSGDDKYNPSNETTSNFSVSKIKVVLNTSNLSMKYGDGSKFAPILTDIDGNPIVGVTVDLTIGGKTYHAITDENGNAKFPILEKPGLYNVVTSFNGSDTYESALDANNKISIVTNPKLIENKDIAMYFLDGTYYKVRATDKYGKFVGAGEIVNIKINGVTYKVKTDAAGYAKLKINLNPKTYTITSEYQGHVVSNKLVVKQTLSASAKTVKKGKSFKYTAKLVDKNKKPVKGKKITFKFKGKTYSAKTNSKGIASIKLKVGSVGKYTISIRYIKNTILKKITVKK